MRINKHDTNGTKPLLGKGELGYDDHTAGGDTGRVYVGNGASNIALAKKSEVDAKVVANAGITAGTATKVTYDAKGLVTSGTNPTTLGGYGITDTYTKTETNTQISTAVNGLVDAAPGTLDTLNELAAALGDDPNFATTIANSIGTKVTKVTSTDNVIVRFDGTTGDIQNSSVIVDDNGNVEIGAPDNNNNTRRIGFTTADGGSSAIESVTIGATNQDLVFKTTYVIESEKMRITGHGNVLVTGGGGLGYGTGAGGTVTQLTSKSTVVTLNKPCGQIVMHNAALAAGATAAFTFYNSSISIYDLVYVISNEPFKYDITTANGAGECTIVIKNKTAGSLSEAIVLTFIVLKGAIA